MVEEKSPGSFILPLEEAQFKRKIVNKDGCGFAQTPIKNCYEREICNRHHDGLLILGQNGESDQNSPIIDTRCS